MTQRGAYLLLMLILAGCDCKPRKEETVDGTIKNISFYGAHNDEDCGPRRGCKWVFVPDKWFLNACSAVECRVVAITHAPWGWQKEGAAIRMTWTPECGSFGREYWDLSIAESK